MRRKHLLAEGIQHAQVGEDDIVWPTKNYFFDKGVINVGGGRGHLCTTMTPSGFALFPLPHPLHCQCAGTTIPHGLAIGCYGTVIVHRGAIGRFPSDAPALPQPVLGMEILIVAEHNGLLRYVDSDRLAFSFMCHTQASNSEHFEP